MNRRRKVWLCVAVAAVLTAIGLFVVACGSGDSAVEETVAPATASSEMTATTESSEMTAATASVDAGDWATLASLRSTDSLWQGMEGLFVSEPFSVSGEARLVLDMIDTGDFVVELLLWIIPADLIPAADDPMGWADAIQDKAATKVTMLAAHPTQEVSGLDGSYVLYVDPYEGSPAWSLELQTR